MTSSRHDSTALSSRVLYAVGAITDYNVRTASSITDAENVLPLPQPTSGSCSLKTHILALSKHRQLQIIAHNLPNSKLSRDRAHFIVISFLCSTRLRMLKIPQVVHTSTESVHVHGKTKPRSRHGIA